MNDNQEDKLGMFEKVKAFLLTNAATLAVVTQIATLQSALNDLIDDIIDADIKATQDDTGYTEEKTQQRINLEEITLKVARALTAYWESIDSKGTLRMTDYGKSELEAMRDNDLYAAAKRLFKVADPLGASLTAFNSGPADVSDLDTKKEAFFADIQNPAMKRGERKEWGAEVERLFGDTDKVLDKLDTYMATFEAINEILYGQYKNARLIDSSGGGAAKVKRGEIPAEDIQNAAFSAELLADETLLEFSNTGTGATLSFYFGALPGSPPEAPGQTILTPGASVQKTAAEAGYNSGQTFANIYNPGPETGKWKIRIITP